MAEGRGLRLGVTGHRRLARWDDVVRDVDAVLDRLLEAHHAERLVAVSSLAEGADRLVAERVLLRPGGALHAVLPLDPADYEEDFPDARSRTTFRELLGDAGSVTSSPPQESREAAYEHAGRLVLDACDVLVALWDGQPARGRGGTAQMVAEARARSMPVEVVTVQRAVERTPDAPAP